MYVIWIVNTYNGTIERNRLTLESNGNKTLEHQLISSVEGQYQEDKIYRLSSHEEVMLSLLGPKEDPGYDSADFSLIEESGDER